MLTGVCRMQRSGDSQPDTPPKGVVAPADEVPTHGYGTDTREIWRATVERGPRRAGL